MQALPTKCTVEVNQLWRCKAVPGGGLLGLTSDHGRKVNDRTILVTFIHVLII